MITPSDPHSGVSSTRAIPTETFFRPSLLAILAKKVGLEANVLVPNSRDLQLEIIRHSGIDPDNLAQYGTPEDGWRLDGKDWPPSLTRRVVLSYLYSHKLKTPLTVKGTKDQWGLTEAGVHEARQYLRAERMLGSTSTFLFGRFSLPKAQAPVQAPVPSPSKRKGNATARFLDKRIRDTGGYKGTFMNALRQAVIKKLPVSYASQQIDDHVQNCFTRLIARDSLAQRLEDGHEITDQQVAMFAVRAAYTDARDSGGNPVCRELYGALTDSERKKGVKLPPIKDSRVVWDDSDEQARKKATWVDLVDESTNPEDLVAFAGIWDQIEDIIRQKKPSVADRYVNLVTMRAQGLSLKEIAEEEEVTPFRAAALMAEARRVLRAGGLDLALGLAPT